MSEKPQKLTIDIPEYNYIIPNNTQIFNRQMKHGKSFEFWKDFEETEDKINSVPLKKIKIK